MREFLIAGNWKMNMLPSQAKMFVQELSGSIDEALHQNPNIRTVVCPPFTNLAGVISELTSSEITVGAQNCYFKDNGAFTGEVSPSMIKAIGCSYCIVGHSERRSIFGETDDMIAQKVRALLAVNVTPILCIGESLEERESGQTNTIVEKQIRAVFEGLTVEEVESIVIAYEPIWAIGTGKSATPEMAEETHCVIRELLHEVANQFGHRLTTKILYGGSMNASNANDLLSKPNIDGGLIGGASLKVQDFSSIISSAISLQ